MPVYGVTYENLGRTRPGMYVDTFHVIKGCNWKGISYLPYQVLRKNHWSLITYFILKIIEKP